MKNEWISVYLETPKEGQIVSSKISGEEGYVLKSKYTNGYFETYRDHGNRLEIIRWKHDLWKLPDPPEEL
jgi:hypothetical protein